MKLIHLFGIAICMVCSNVLGADHDDDSDIYVDLYDMDEEDRREIIDSLKTMTEEERFQKDKASWKSYCKDRRRSFNSYDTEPLRIKLLNEMEDDPVAKGAMDIFLESNKFWEFVDYCVDNIKDMKGENQEKYKEILILLAPGLKSTRYMKRAVNIIGRDQKEVTINDIKHIPFCTDMFFYGAVKNGHYGRYALAKMCEEAFYIPCPYKNWDCNGCTDKRFTSYDIGGAVFPDEIFDDMDEIGYFISSIWPNWKSVVTT
jgi:hypothetical protein